MAKVQAVEVAGEGRTWTVLGDDHAVAAPVEEFLEHHRVVGSSPHTVRSYAKALERWWSFLAEADTAWDEVEAKAMTEFVTWLRHGWGPLVAGVGEAGEPRVAETTVAARLAAVVAFYRYHHDAHGLVTPIWSSRPGVRPFGRYRGMLTHLDRRRRACPSLVVRLAPHRRGPTPVLEPAQVRALLDGCAVADSAAGAWSGCLRDRLLFATLAEAGLRLGEALCLTNADWHVAGGETPFLEVTPRAHPHGARVKGNARRVHVSDELARLYSDWLWTLAEVAGDAGRMVTDDWFCFVNLSEPRFAAIRPETVYATVRRLRRRLAGVVPAAWTPHWLRHTHATALLLAGVPLHVVSRRLGHADVQTTMNLYGWVTEEAELRSVAEWRRFAEGWRTGAGDA